MQEKSRLDIFTSSSSYTDPVDINKLRFIFSAIDRYAIQRNKDVENLRVLEVGCGTGGVTFPLSSLGCQVRAFDVDEKSVEYVQTQISQKEIRNLVVTVDDAYAFDDGKTYDVVVASDVFECILEPAKAVANITRRMGVRSHWIVTIPNGYGPWELKNRISPITYLRKWNWLRRLLGRRDYVKGSGAHRCQFYTKKGLIKLFSKSSLRLVDFAKSDSLLAMFGPLRRSTLFGNIDVKLADILPYWLASGWYFVFELKTGNHEQ